MDEFDVMAKAMIEKEITNDKFQEILLKAYPKPDVDASKLALTKWQNKIEQLEEIYVGDFNHMIAGTAWGAFNALTERIDWHRSARGGNNESLLASASGFDAATNAEKNRLLQLVQTVTA
jgi:hypothetical protein